MWKASLNVQQCADKAPNMIEGSYNFREIGGLVTRKGQPIKSGRLYRSDTLQALTAADVEYLHERLGLRGIVDLRLGWEVAGEGKGPLAYLPDIKYVNSPLDVAATEGVAPDEVMDRLYLSALAPGSKLGEAVEHICDLSEQPVVFHCAAGKDRTGMLAALILRLLNVDDKAIISEYMLSSKAMPRMIERFSTWPAYREHMMLAPPNAYRVEEAPLRAFLHHLDHEFGGAHAWVEANGVSSSSLKRLISNVL